MRIAVFSDLHGNPFALEAVIERLSGEGDLDAIVAAGDLAFGGSDPAGCVDRLRELGIQAVYGNTEVYVHSPEKAPGDWLHLKKWDRILEDVAWVREKLGEERIRWMRDLPFDLRFSPSGRRKDDLLIVHANPRNIEDMLYPPEEDQVRLIGEVVQPDDDARLLELLRGVEARTLAFGHYHFTSERVVSGKRLVNVAPASMPAKDHDPRARYTVFAWDGEMWRVERQHIKYDYAQEIRALAQSEMPHWKEHAGTFPDP